MTGYRRVLAHLREDVLGVLEPGDGLPPERELAIRFGVARMTVRRALDELATEGLIDRLVGVGTFVAYPKRNIHVQLTSYTEEMTRRGMIPTATVLDFGAVAASDHVARQLRLEPGDAVLRYRRLFYADGQPMSVDENFLVPQHVPGMAKASPPPSLYRYLSEEYGLVIDWGEDTIEATSATPSLARLLTIDARDPLLKIERRAYVGRVIVDFSVSYYRADRYRLSVPLQRPRRAQQHRPVLRGR
ncbi:GntR family transcriptional regulator [Tersicoccus sp. MR15.9]|uniref:GntR family transcriptional regulator n=1 Tax=Tersicoccus mangrovi TaxID=3121635 RepID=UPI002FE53851